jgi:hypothetical protein
MRCSRDISDAAGERYALPERLIQRSVSLRRIKKPLPLLFWVEAISYTAVRLQASLIALPIILLIRKYQVKHRAKITTQFVGFLDGLE